MQITFREQWLDRRLSYEHLDFPYLPKFLTVPHIKNNVWMPDSFFPVGEIPCKDLGQYCFRLKSPLTDT